MNAIIPLTKLNLIKDEDFVQPSILQEVDGFPLLKFLTKNLTDSKLITSITFIVSKDDAYKYNLVNLLKVLVPNSSVVILETHTKGAPCSILMASDFLDKGKNIIILNPDQYFTTGLDIVLEKLVNVECGVATFQAVHPRWSYVKYDLDNSRILKCEEKNPISSDAIAGLYFFKNYELFHSCTSLALKKEEFVNDNLYTSALINQAILLGKRVEGFSINNETYYTFYSKTRIKEFQVFIERQ